MNGLIKTIRLDSILRSSALLSVIMILLIIIVPGIVYLRLPPFLPLLNQMPWGEPRLITKLAIFFPSCLLLLITGLNIFLSSLTHEKMPLISRMLAITTVLVGLLFLIFVIRTILLIL